MKSFNQDRFLARVDKTLKHVRILLENSKSPGLPADVAHSYQDKYFALDLVTRTAIATQGKWFCENPFTPSHLPWDVGLGQREVGPSEKLCKGPLSHLEVQSFWKLCCRAHKTRERWGHCQPILRGERWFQSSMSLTLRWCWDNNKYQFCAETCVLWLAV